MRQDQGIIFYGALVFNSFRIFYLFVRAVKKIHGCMAISILKTCDLNVELLGIPIRNLLCPYFVVTNSPTDPPEGLTSYVCRRLPGFSSAREIEPCCLGSKHAMTLDFLAWLRPKTMGFG